MNLKLRIKQLVFFTFILVGSIAFAQQSVSGTVSDNEGPLPGVSVIIKGTAQGVVTDFDGNYTISVSNQEAELVFSYLGFLTQEITVGSNSNLDVQLIEDVQGLEEVVVTQYNLTGYIQVDTELIHVDESNYRYSISGLNEGYEVGDKSPGAVSKVLGAIFNPADFL